MSILMFIFAASAGATGILLSGWSMTLLWLWFVTPLGLPELSIAHAIGLASVVALCVPWPQYPEEKDPLIRIGRAFALLWGKPLYVLAIGWLAKTFM